MQDPFLTAAVLSVRSQEAGRSLESAAHLQVRSRRGAGNRESQVDMTEGRPERTAEDPPRPAAPTGASPPPARETAVPHSPNTRLRLLLQDAGWGPAQLALAIGKAAAERDLGLVCHRTTAGRWTEGVQPRPPFAALILECLSRRLGRRVTAQEAGLTRAPAAVADLSWEADPVRKLTHLTDAELDPRRRTLPGAGVFTLSALALPYAPSASRAADRFPGRARDAGAEQMRTMATVFAATADQQGGQHVRATLSAYLAHQVIPRLHAATRGQARADVLSAAAQLTLLLGGMCVDAGHDGAAQHYQQIAARLAADADDRTTLAIALRTMAAHAHDLSHHTPAVLNLAEQAARHARHAPPAVRSYAHVQLAVLQAHHDRRAALNSLAQAERLFTRADSAPGPFSSYPPGALHYQRASTLATVGDHSAALKALTASLRLRAAGERLPAALTRARLAETHLRLGHLDQALPHWRAFLDVYPTLNSLRASRCLTAAARHLRPYRRHHGAAGVLDSVLALAGDRRNLP